MRPDTAISILLERRPRRRDRHVRAACLLAFARGDWRGAIGLAGEAARRQHEAKELRMWLPETWKSLLLISELRLDEAHAIIEAGTREAENVSRNIRVWSMLRCRARLAAGQPADARAEAVPQHPRQRPAGRAGGRALCYPAADRCKRADRSVRAAGLGQHPELGRDRNGRPRDPGGGAGVHGPPRARHGNEDQRLAPVADLPPGHSRERDRRSSTRHFLGHQASEDQERRTTSCMQSRSGVPGACCPASATASGLSWPA